MRPKMEDAPTFARAPYLLIKLEGYHKMGDREILYTLPALRGPDSSPDFPLRGVSSDPVAGSACL
jgi:hypothetical protein